jgi:hypothetical protein
MNGHLGAEYFNIAESLTRGRGFADPFREPTGPTAWMPPALPFIQAGLLWACDGDRAGLMAIVVFLQVNALLGTGLLVLLLAGSSGMRLGAGIGTAAFIVGLVCHFNLCFQFTHDCWLVLLAMDVLIAGICWLRPLECCTYAAAWGLFGGFCALINPVVGLIWAVLASLTGFRQRAWFNLATALLVAGFTLAPWTIRNYLVFGHLIPVKSNLGYELYQSQCLQPDGLLRFATFDLHPSKYAGPERDDYKAVGEMAYMERKRQQFCEAVWANPQDFVRRIGERLLGATVWYEPFQRSEVAKRPWVFLLSRWIHPLPFLGLLALLLTAAWKRIDRVQWNVIAIYCLYLLPYIAVSYYDRYGVPLLGVKVLFVIWGADRLVLTKSTLSELLLRRATNNPNATRPSACALNPDPGRKVLCE